MYQLQKNGKHHSMLPEVFGSLDTLEVPSVVSSSSSSSPSMS